MRFKYQAGNDDKDRIFDIAFALMEEIGYEKLTIRKICEEADISIGKFYRYFDSKQQLLSFFYDQAGKAYEEECAEKLIGMETTDQLIRFYTWYMEYTTEFGVEFVTHFFNNQNAVMNTHIYNNPIIEITDSILERGVRNGFRIPEGKSIRDISNDLCVIVKGIIFDWCVRHGEFSLSEYTKDLLTRCIRGLFTE